MSFWWAERRGRREERWAAGTRWAYWTSRHWEDWYSVQSTWPDFYYDFLSLKIHFNNKRLKSLQQIFRRFRFYWIILRFDYHFIQHVCNNECPISIIKWSNLWRELTDFCQFRCECQLSHLAESGAAVCSTELISFRYFHFFSSHKWTSDLEHSISDMT